jgi:hypothetical protein
MRWCRIGTSSGTRIWFWARIVFSASCPRSCSLQDPSVPRLARFLAAVPSSYLDYSGRADRLSGGSQLIPVSTPAGAYRVWVKRTGSNPDVRLLLLHGGPGATHEYLEACDSLPPGGGRGVLLLRPARLRLQ